jgi:hypothetical protein
MPYLETVEELAEALADLLGIYNQGLQFVGMTVKETRAYNDSRSHGDCDGDHAHTCQCRMCWIAAMERRIRAVVAHEQILSSKAHLRREAMADRCRAANPDLARDPVLFTAWVDACLAEQAQWVDVLPRLKSGDS